MKTNSQDITNPTNLGLYQDVCVECMTPNLCYCFDAHRVDASVSDGAGPSETFSLQTKQLTRDRIVVFFKGKNTLHVDIMLKILRIDPKTSGPSWVV